MTAATQAGCVSGDAASQRQGAVADDGARVAEVPFGQELWYMSGSSQLVRVTLEPDGSLEAFTSSVMQAGDSRTLPSTGSGILTVLADGSLLGAINSGPCSGFSSHLFHIAEPPREGGPAVYTALGVMPQGIGVEALHTDCDGRVYAMDTGVACHTQPGNRLLRFLGEVTAGDFSFDVVSDLSDGVPDIDDMSPGLGPDGEILDNPGLALDSRELYTIDYQTGDNARLGFSAAYYGIHAFPGSAYADGRGRVYATSLDGQLYDISPSDGGTLHFLGTGPGSSYTLAGAMPPECQTGFRQPPVAQCRDLLIDAGDTCEAAASIDDGSHDPDGAPEPLTLTQSPAGPYGLGSHLVTLTASDGEDSATCTGTVTVVDGAAPALDGCYDRVFDAVPGLGGAYVEVEVSAEDACDGATPVTCDLAPGTFLGMGESVPVTCTSADSAGNTSTCSVSVQVTEPSQCEASDPRPQDYWRTQCNGRDAAGTPPDAELTADILQRLLGEVEGDIQSVCQAEESTCEALNPDPFWDACETACQEYASWLLNLASARVPSSCCNYGGTAADAAGEIAARIAAGECADARQLAYDLNRGCEFCE
ncbi:HYR domain-containing protein [Haliangium ochraceum]|uniref:HYR domain-containing protein n=1 Tax=Haliangium ochraceum TaxID=80816 RepID=UPI00019B9F0E|nr:HYR domain-containing protein [Haliangium ochraceum]